MRVLALDVATQCGVAFGAAGDKPVTSSVDLGRGQPEPQRFARAVELVACLIEKHSPDFCAVEAPIGGNTKSTFLIGLAACVQSECLRRGVPCEVFMLASIRKHFVGKNLTLRDYPGLSQHAAKKAIKQVVVDRCRLLGWTVEDDNAADAAALWDFACAKQKAGYHAAPSGGLFHGK